MNYLFLLMHLLFICSRNQWRSPTAENIYSAYPGVEARSAGLAASAIRQLNEKLVAWADVIFVMEHQHKKLLLERFRDHVANRKLIVLDIADEYGYMDPELVDMIRTAVDAVLFNI